MAGAERSGQNQQERIVGVGFTLQYQRFRFECG
jgi:hypothetical protein